MAAADQLAFVFQQNPGRGLRPLPDHGDGQGIIEIDLGGLPPGASPEGGATMMSQAFQIHGVGLALDDPGLGAAGTATENVKGQRGDAGLQLVQQEAAHGLVAAGDQGGIHPGVAKPGLGGLAAQPATKAIQITVRVGLPPVLPGLHTPLPFLAADQLVTQINGRLLAMLLVADANPVAFVVVDQGDIGGAREGALGEFHRSTHIQQGRVVEKQGQVITGIVAHGKRV